MREGLKKIYERRLEFAYDCAHRAETVKEFNFFVDRIKEIKEMIEEV